MNVTLKSEDQPNYFEFPKCKLFGCDWINGISRNGHSGLYLKYKNTVG